MAPRAILPRKMVLKGCILGIEMIRLLVLESGWV
jgi:hypothetical protein